MATMPQRLVKPKLLWVDSDNDLVSRLKSEILSERWEFDRVETSELARQSIKAKSYSVAFVNANIGESESLKLLGEIKRESPESTRLLYSEKPSINSIEKAVNEAQVFRYLTGLVSNEELVMAIDRAIKSHKGVLTQKEILFAISRQNKKLEELTQGLERLVEERTRDIKKSKDEAAKQLQSMRGLLTFIKELSSVTVVDDWLKLLGEELRHFHGMGGVVLGFVSTNGAKHVITFRGRELLEKKIAKPWPKIEKLRIANKEDQKFLIDLYSRPFANLISIPLETEKESSVLYIENSLSESQQANFNSFLSARLQPLTLSLDRILLEIKTKYASRQWEATFDGIQEPVAIIDLDYNLIRANEEYHSRDMQGVCYKLFANRESICPGCPVAKALKTGEPQSDKITIEGKIYEIHSYPIRSRGGLTNVINHYSDITEERKLFGRLVQNEKMVAIGSLAGNIAHELNNPLTGLHSLAQLIQAQLKSPENKQLKSDLYEIELATKRSQGIIKNLLDYSKPGDLKGIIVVSLNETVKRTLPMLKAGIRDYRNEIRLCDEELLVRIEPQLMQQVVFNLVHNACQAMGEEGTLTIETSIRHRDGKDYCVLMIEDTGPGIDREKLEQIFEPFFTTKIAEQGTGIGLSMSRSIVESFGGKIEVESRPNIGTKFQIVLPRTMEVK